MLETLELRKAEAEAARVARIAGEALSDEQRAASAGFRAWYTRCVDLLVLDPKVAPPFLAAHVAVADVERAVAVAESQAAEGDAHARRLDDLARELGSLGAAAPPPPSAEVASAVVADVERSAKSAHIKKLASSLRTAASGAPPAEPAPVEAVVAALKAAVHGGTAKLDQPTIRSLMNFILTDVFDLALPLQDRDQSKPAYLRDDDDTIPDYTEALMLSRQGNQRGAASSSSSWTR